MGTRVLIVSGLLFSFCSCSLVVRSMLEKKEGAGDGEIDGQETDGAEPDLEEDAAADVSPENCVIFGRVYVPDHAAVNINTDLEAFDGEGDLGWSVVDPVPGNPDNVLFSSYAEYSVDIKNDFFYCIPADRFSGMDQAFLLTVFLDVSQMPDNNTFVFHSLVPDPRTVFLYSFYSQTGMKDHIEDAHYWNGEDSIEINIPLERRVSRYIGTIHFSDSFPGGVRDGVAPRVCVGAIEDTGYVEPVMASMYIGSNMEGLPDHAATGGNTYPFSVNVAARPGKTFSVFIFYLERQHYDTDHPCGVIGGDKSCFMKIAVIEMDHIGGEYEDPDPFPIEPVTGPCPLEVE